MNNPSLLKQFEYFLPVSTISVTDKLPTTGVEKHSSLFKLRIDFISGILILEGNRKYISITNFHERSYLINSNSDRIRIETLISPVKIINLNKPETDGMLFPMKGYIENANCLVPCTGFLMLDKTGTGNKYLKDHWNISCYFYDIEFTDFEINFSLPM